MKKPPEKLSTSIDRVSELYDQVDELLAVENLPPEMAIRLFEIEQRLDKVIEAMEKQVQSQMN